MVGDRLHHVGIVVHDLAAATETYRRLGFTVAAATYPALPREPGAPARPIGAANAHIYLGRNFVELVTVVDEDQPLPAGAELLPIVVPDDRLPGMLAGIRGAAARLTGLLDRGEGVHIVIFDSADIDRSAAELDAAGIVHSGVQAVQRPIETADGTRMVPAHYLEILGAGPARIGIAQNSAAEQPVQPVHANGAVELIDCTLPSPDGEHRPAVSLVTGERLAFTGFTLAVRDITVTEDHLRSAGIPFARTPDTLTVPADQAFGATITFRR
ncbi:hypothetical protein GCM10009828_083040 [Actinoplanes couchii]|uniref:Glyoxalase-like domain-containing protein n=1 Tax=Actinoplanes couchii TaxID=403638 RepID=A0ABQ3XKP0_9ACTN|nr:hypothetical protein Aco03nite_074710 [Actinoplanes couchii]